MKEVSHDKGLKDPAYTEEEFDRAVREGEARQAGDTGSSDPVISVEDAQQITVITLMRIYDMLGAILTHLDEDAADAILEQHANGKLVGPLPSLDI